MTTSSASLVRPPVHELQPNLAPAPSRAGGTSSPRNKSRSCQLHSSFVYSRTNSPRSASPLEPGKKSANASNPNGPICTSNLCWLCHEADPSVVPLPSDAASEGSPNLVRESLGMSSHAPAKE